MLDTNVWTRQYGDYNFADYVIGGPTLEMFVASWNTKHPDSKIYCNGTGFYSRYGYCLGNTSGSTGDYMNIGTSDRTYVKTSSYKAYAFWLASPLMDSHGYGTGIMHVDRDGSVGNYHDSFYDDFRRNYGFRPLVCLSSNVKLVSNSDGTYSLTK